MDPSTLWLAFLFGLVSAGSLPLGTLTAAVWRPADRVLAFLMSFGGGALLVALTLDLAAPAVRRGDFAWLAVGCIAGGVLFVVLDQMVNNHGGFLRKVSTTVFHFWREEHKRVRETLVDLRRLELFSALPRAEIVQLAQTADGRRFREGSALFRVKDPSEHLFIVEDGAVELIDPDEPNRPAQRLGKNAAFGHMAFLTGAPHAMVALATRETEVWAIPRSAFRDLLASSATLRESTRQLLRDERMRHYLQHRHDLDENRARAWVDDAVDAVSQGRPIPRAVEPDHAAEEASAAIRGVRRVPLFRDLPDEDIQLIPSRCFCKRHEAGHSFFHAGEPAERIYIIDSGTVALINPRNPKREPEEVGPHEEFGALSFLTGARHSTSAVATTEVTVWVLLRRHFDEALGRSRALAMAVETYVQGGELTQYLREKHRFHADKAAKP